jgi:predicted MFS family arabinose efflux permease
MSFRTLKGGVFAATSLTTLATFYFFTYLFFYLRDRFGFDDRANLAVAALHGAIYIVAAWQGGRFAERHGYVTSLRVGFGGLTACMVVGWLAGDILLVTLGVVVVYTIVLLLIWPALEAMAMADEPPARVSHMVGLYNLTWSGSAALAYFTGGPLYDWLGADLIFTVPGVIFGLEFLVLVWLKQSQAFEPHRPDVPEVIVAAAPSPLPGRHRRAATFLRLGWLANPLSYMAIYTLLALMPGLAAALGLTPTQVGLFCAIWMFARMVSFGLLWQWAGWHYRFRFLLAGYLVLIASFLAMLLAPSLPMLVIGQVLFGAASGITYYSSLFYSMDASDTKAEHGGLHEAGVGIGICTGPAVGALSLTLWPAWPYAGAVAVTGVLAAGLGVMVAVWRSDR